MQPRLTVTQRWMPIRTQRRTQRRVAALFALAVCAASACTGRVGAGAGSGNNGTGNSGAGNSGSGSNNGGAGSGTGPTGGAGNDGAGGDGLPPPPPFEAVNSLSAVRKVKNLLTGLAPTDQEVTAGASASGLRTLITTWTTGADFQPLFRDKMIFFFRNAFQQTGFTPTEDFKMQLLQNGGFDFGPLGTNAVGDDAFTKLVQNLQDSFALTTWQLISDGRPFTDVLTTQRFMMTTALKSLYLQIETPNDQPYAFGGTTAKLAWKVDMSGTAIPLEQTLDPTSANYMVFDDQVPVNAARFQLQPTCQGTAGMVNAFTGYAQLFQRLLGYTPRFPFAATPTCWEHASRPYFTATDLSDWQWVNVRALRTGETRLLPYDLPTLRKTTELGLQLPRAGFFTTPAYLALWNTNDSNQHRVTANQTLLVALGQSVSSENTIVPLSAAGLDGAHAVTGTECFGCHKLLDPLRQFWATQFDYNDRNDFPTRGTFMGGVANPRPAATGGALAFANVNANGASLPDLGPLLLQVSDGSDGNAPISRFAIAVTQKLCFFANSSACVETDPELRRVAAAFASGGFTFQTLIVELFSSPLVTGAAATATFDQLGMTVSVARRDQLCASLSNRLAKPDLCALAASLPTTAQAATAKIATSVAADAFSRGAESPVTPNVPTVFYRAATEMLCENVAALVVDSTTGKIFSSTDVPGAVEDMTTRIIGYPPSDPHHADAAKALSDHYVAVLAVNRNTATTALRSTFALACQSPTALSFGL
jgi:hypothetical protein